MEAPSSSVSTKVVPPSVGDSSKPIVSSPQVNTSRCGSAHSITLPGSGPNGWSSKWWVSVAPVSQRSISMRVGNQERISTGSVTACHTSSTGRGRNRSNRRTGLSPVEIRVASRMGFSFGGQVRLEAVEAGAPHLPVGLEPRVELDQWFGPQAVEPTLSVHADLDEAGLAQ